MQKYAPYTALQKKCLQTSWFCGFLFVTFSSMAVIWLPLGERAGSLGQGHWKSGNKKEVVQPIGNLWGNAEEESNLLSDRKSYRRQMSSKIMLGDVSEDGWGSRCLCLIRCLLLHFRAWWVVDEGSTVKWWARVVEHPQCHTEHRCLASGMWAQSSSGYWGEESRLVDN